MTLRFDPGDGDIFKAAIRQIPGYPAGEALPIRTMLFASGALWQVPALLESAGAAPGRPLLVVMDLSRRTSLPATATKTRPRKPWSSSP